MSRLQHRIIRLISLCTLVALTSCASKSGPGSLRDDPLQAGSVDEMRVKRLSVEQLYASAREALDSSDYATALQLYDRLDAQYPFSAYATQGKLESIYAHYRAYAPELAISAADRFVRANPRHPDLDYVFYLRGLVNFDRGASSVLEALDIDAASRDPINSRRSFEDFGRLVQRFPTSPYAADARQRMVYLKDRIAQHEFAIAQYYEKRRAWVAASRRAQDIISKYQGSKVVPQAMDMLARCYDALQQTERAAQIRAVRKASNFPTSAEKKKQIIRDAPTPDAKPAAMPTASPTATAAPVAATPAAAAHTASEPAPTAAPATAATPQPAAEPLMGNTPVL